MRTQETLLALYSAIRQVLRELPRRSRRIGRYTCCRRRYRGLVGGSICDRWNREIVRVVAKDPKLRDRLTRLLCDAMNAELGA